MGQPRRPRSGGHRRVGDPENLGKIGLCPLSAPDSASAGKWGGRDVWGLTNSSCKSAPYIGDGLWDSAGRLPPVPTLLWDCLARYAYGMGKAADSDPAMTRARKAFAESGLSLDELGRRMGYEGETARKGAWQFLNQTADPRLSTLRRFAAAVGVPVSELVGE